MSDKTNKLKDLYESVKIDKKVDPNVLKAQEEHRLALLEEKRLRLEKQINTAMDTIAKNKDKGYCILDYGANPSDVANSLREAGFEVTKKNFGPLVGHRGCFERHSLIVSWQEFDPATYEKIVGDLSTQKRREHSKFMSQD